MRIADFQKRTEAELLQLADDCFVAMDTAGVEQKPAFLLQAQLYMNQANRVEDSRVAIRDFRLEIAVIVLIGIEIILSVVGLWYGIREGSKQMAVLGQLNASADATAKTSAAQALALPKLVDEQTKSLDSLSDMNSKLKDSLQQTTAMSRAMRDQLKILQDEQAVRLAELAKKPKLELYVGGIPLNSLTNIPIPSRESTTTKTTWVISLRNSGTGAATKGVLRVIVFGKDVTLDCSSVFERVFEPETDSAQHAILIPFERARATGNLSMSITANYPKGQQVFSIVFNVDADEIPVATLLGVMTVNPPKP
jgi:hypothetical protein